jgi:hypothetical protein
LEFIARPGNQQTAAMPAAPVVALAQCGAIGTVPRFEVAGELRYLIERRGEDAAP